MKSSDKQEKEIQEYFDRVQQMPEGRRRLARAEAVKEIARTHGAEASMRLVEKFRHSNQAPAQAQSSET